ncbi:MAG: hypothetical protein Q4A28_04265, partial [Brachymonas sp.]|nr:hypothetical protein [Brachymonas sp.]
SNPLFDVVAQYLMTTLSKLFKLSTQGDRRRSGTGCKAHISVCGAMHGSFDIRKTDDKIGSAGKAPASIIQALNKFQGRAWCFQAARKRQAIRQNRDARHTQNGLPRQRGQRGNKKELAIFARRPPFRLFFSPFERWTQRQAPAQPMRTAPPLLPSSAHPARAKHAKICRLLYLLRNFHPVLALSPHEC